MKNSLTNSNQGPGSNQDCFRLHLSMVPAFRALLRGVECRLLATVDFPEPLLDIGSGDGTFAEVLGQGRWFAGMDVWPQGAREAKQREAYRHVMLASGTRIPFADGVFGSVVSNCVLEHIPDVDAVVGEANRVLRPGGTFALTVPSHRFAELLFGSTFFRRIGLTGPSRAYGNWFNRHSRHYHCDTPQQWEGRLGEAGFGVDRWQYYMSPAAVRALDLAHYYGVPSLLLRKLTGKWVLGDGQWNDPLAERWLRKYYEEPPPREGGYIFIVAHKVRDLQQSDVAREGAGYHDRTAS